MPWERKTVEDLRKEFALASQTSKNFSALCREYGISRQTGYTWAERARNGEPMTDRSRCPQTTANKTPEETEKLILSVREENPGWGGKTIRTVLERQGHEHLPCAKTCNNILKRNGYIDPEESLKHMPYQRFERDRCNELWQTDFKGDFPLENGRRCFPLTILDDHSRFSVKIASKPDTLGVKDSFREAFLEYGLPDSVLSTTAGRSADFITVTQALSGGSWTTMFCRFTEE